MLTESIGLIMMPDNVYDLQYLFFSTFTLFAVSATGVVVWYFLRRICSKMDSMHNAIGDLRTSEAVNGEKIVTHIENEAVHCKGVNCVKAVV